MAFLEVERISKSFGPGRQALQDCCFDLGDHERVAILGPTGSGKTTLLRIIAGLEQPDAGSIRLAGSDIVGLAPWQRRIGLVFQRPALIPHRNVLENLRFPLELDWTLQKNDQSVASVVRMLALQPLLYRKPAELSGGERQRVAIGRALVRRPSLFLFDEPFSHLDARTREELRRQLQCLQRVLTTPMVMVTHDQAEAAAWAERLILIDRGRIQQVGPPRQLLLAPRSLFVARFCGSPPMNLALGKIEKSSAFCFFKTAEWSIPLLNPTIIKALSITDQPVALGVRPTNVRLATHSDAFRLAMQVDLREDGEKKARLICRQDDIQWTVEVPLEVAVREGESVYLTFDELNARFFDGVTGEAIGGCAPEG